MLIINIEKKHMAGIRHTFPLLSFARLLVPSIKFVKCAMRINLAAILRVKIAWSRASKRLVPRTDAYKMTATTVSVLCTDLYING